MRFLNDFLTNLSSCELIALASIFAITISQGLNEDEIGILGNFFSSLGDNLELIASATPSSSNTNEVTD